MSLKYVLLTMLSRERQTGYDIVKSFDSSIGYFWRASHQQVYRELSKLTDSELLNFSSVAQGDKPDKKIYRITASGKKELREWVEAPVPTAHTKDLLLVKLLNVSQSNAQVIISELDRVSGLVNDRLDIYEGIENKYYKPSQVNQLGLDDLPLYLALRQGITGNESYISWLAETRKAILKAIE